MKNITKQLHFNINEIWSVNDKHFEHLCEKFFYFHYYNNKIYRRFCDYINKTPQNTTSIQTIPFLPISFFKNFIVSVKKKHDLVFLSSGTTSLNRSKHYIHNKYIYETSLLKIFTLFFGEPSQYTFLALMPSYDQLPNSSLVYMLHTLMQFSKSQYNNFYLNKLSKLAVDIEKLQQLNHKIILFGITYALLEFIEQYKVRINNENNFIVIETGGMKGMKKEIVPQQLHNEIKNALGVSHVYSEYGMTELCSQAYSTENRFFKTPPWMKVLIRDINDPFTFLNHNKIGALNIIDLANIFSCPFIATDDVGKINADGTFEVLGRLDNSDLRGCSLLS